MRPNKEYGAAVCKGGAAKRNENQNVSDETAAHKSGSSAPDQYAHKTGRVAGTR